MKRVIGKCPFGLALTAGIPKKKIRIFSPSEGQLVLIDQINVGRL